MHKRRDHEDDDAEQQIARRVERRRCRSGGAFRRCVTAPPPSSSMTVGMIRNTNMAHMAPTMPALTPRRRNAARTRGRCSGRWRRRSAAPRRSRGWRPSRCLRRRDDDRGRGGADQQQDGEAAEREGARDGADLLLPAAMIVERDALKSSAERRRAARSRSGGSSRSISMAMRRGTGSDLSTSDCAEPRLQQLGGFGQGSARSRCAMPRCCRRKPHDVAQPSSRCRRFPAARSAP